MNLKAQCPLSLLAYITSQPLSYEIEAVQIIWVLSTNVCPINTKKKYDSLPTLATKYSHAQNVLTVINIVKLNVHDLS